MEEISFITTSMNISIARVDKTLPLPKYETAGAVAFDLICRTNVTIEPRGVELIPVNIIVKIPPGHALLLSSRSSTAKKRGLIIPLGIIDQDFCGPEDELRLQTLNFTNEPITVSRGDRIGQGLFVEISQAEWDEVDTMEGASRGGFGTTGV